MDFELPSDIKMVVDTVQRFREKELVPLEPNFLQTGKLSKEVRFALERKGREHDLWALDVPVEEGGMGLGEVAMCAVTEEIWKSPVMFEFGGHVEPALYYCSPRQKECYF